MANLGRNQGRRLRLAISRFAAMLIEEARDLTGLSYAKLDEALGLECGSSYRYSLYPPRAKTRAPQAGGIQSLENRVAKLLRRPAHKIVIERTSPLLDGCGLHNAIDLFTGEPAADIDLRDSPATELELAYEYDWPTYSRLGKFNLARVREQNRLVNLYAWQWGILWDRDVLAEQWSREALGIPANVPVEAFLPDVVEQLAVERYQEYLHRLSLRMSSSEKETDQRATLRTLWRIACRQVGEGDAPDLLLEYYRSIP